MEVLVDGSGRRVFVNQPYIDDSELKRNVLIYNPNQYNLGTGLYERTRPACMRWVDHFHQHEMKYGTRPMYTLDADGRTFYPQSTSIRYN
jgi:hypothetical protein